MIVQIGRAHVSTPVPPRSPLFPYTTLFRSHPNHFARRSTGQRAHTCSQALPRLLNLIPTAHDRPDRKSTRLNSSPTEISSLSLHDALPISSKPLCSTIDWTAGSYLFSSAAQASKLNSHSA